MPLTNFPNGISTGGKDGVTAAYPVMSVRFTFDPTSASQVSIATLPPNAVVLDVVGFGGATGGTNPTVDIGTSGDDDGIANELDCDAAGTRASSAATVGALINAVLSTTATTTIYGKVGASAATGGTFAGAIEYVVIA